MHQYTSPDHVLRRLQQKPFYSLIFWTAQKQSSRFAGRLNIMYVEKKKKKRPQHRRLNCSTLWRRAQHSVRFRSHFQSISRFNYDYETQQIPQTIRITAEIARRSKYDAKQQFVDSLVASLRRVVSIAFQFIIINYPLVGFFRLRQLTIILLSLHSIRNGVFVSCSALFEFLLYLLFFLVFFFT